MSDETKIEGMGTIPHVGGVAFCVWAPHAQRVAVIGSFNDWDGDKCPMQIEENGFWYADVAEARVSAEYRFSGLPCLLPDHSAGVTTITSTLVFCSTCLAQLWIVPW